jgi:membrane protein YdbS with pleckstrin-like domain
MRCFNCGSYVAPGVRFCSSCGSPADDPESTRIARSQPVAGQGNGESDALEHKVFTVRPTMLFVKVGYALSVIGAIAAVILLAWLGLPWWIALPPALALLLIPAYYHIKRNMIRYTVTDSTIEIDTGLISRTTRSIPLSKIQDVTVSATIPQRILGFGDVVVDNASEVGGTTVLKNINNPRHYADLLLRELRRWQ